MQSREPNVTTGGHPSGLNLSSIPATQEIDSAPPDGPEPTVKGVLRALAMEFQAAMEDEAQAFVSSCRRMDDARIVMFRGKYDAWHRAYCEISRIWGTFEFDGAPQPNKVWHTLQGHAAAIVQATGNDIPW